MSYLFVTFKIWRILVFTDENGVGCQVLSGHGECITSSLHSQASGQNGVAQGRRKRRRKTVENEKTLSSEEKLEEEGKEEEEVEKGERRGGGGSITA